MNRLPCCRDGRQFRTCPFDGTGRMSRKLISAIGLTLGDQSEPRHAPSIDEFGTHARLTAHWFPPTEMAERRRGIIGEMTDVTQILSNRARRSICFGAASALGLSGVTKTRSGEAFTKTGQTLQATALVHEAYCVWLMSKGSTMGKPWPFLPPPRPRQCGGFWSMPRVARVR